MVKIIEVSHNTILIIGVMDIICEVIRDMGDRIIITEGETFRNQNYDRNRSRSYERQNRDRRDDRSVSNNRLRSGSRATTNRESIRCFECRKYNHFVRDCPTTQAKREVEQIQQMFNMDEDQTILQTTLMDVDQVGQSISPVETRNNSYL